MRRSIEGGVYQRVAFFPNGWLKAQRSIEGGVYERAAMIRRNTVYEMSKYYLVRTYCIRIRKHAR